ncbi:hypothetical protein PGB28_14090 [Primorskyibacter aestuariivivens]|uniref:hypothetical protein n=1 Tax=Primorskyibacter aestuariivivens TaxID=1888912 RepID=UPI0023008D40|nr:hypothetical protein [Primorskyibacter aestuariivivens]MDA7429596.1 hypothetical protein [Primorskyibacter aestuariivivens]
MTFRISHLLGASAVVLAAGSAYADQVILDDLIVDGSACIGQDCVNGESFGFDTLRLKENNLRIKAQDTSSSASFPTTDWQITFNDSANGGANKFSIDDIDAGRTPFTIEAGSIANALYVDSSGDVGIGTATPVVELHAVDGNTPALRLEQNGSSGFTAQTWDLAGNETNFFIRDVTNSSKLPFKIKPGAPTNALFVAADGDLGLGTQTPSAALHIVRPSAILRMESSSDNSSVRFVSNSKEWEFGDAGNGQLKLSEIGSGQTDFRFSDEGMFRINSVSSPPTTNVGTGAIYVDSDSNSLCFRSGAQWLVVAGSGPCS